MFDVRLLKVDASQESINSQHIQAGVLVAGHIVMIAVVVAEGLGLCYAPKRVEEVEVEELIHFKAL